MELRLASQSQILGASTSVLLNEMEPVPLCLEPLATEMIEDSLTAQVGWHVLRVCRQYMDRN